VIEIKDEEIDEVPFRGDHQREMLITQSVKSIKEAWNDVSVKQEKETKQDETKKMEEKVTSEQQKGIYVTCSGSISQPLQRLIETAHAVINEKYLQNFHHDNNNPNSE
jgi:hypothetical protein